MTDAGRGLNSVPIGLALAHQLLGAPLPESAANLLRADRAVPAMVAEVVHNLRQAQDSGEAVSRYRFQMRAKSGLMGKAALGWNILTGRTAEDGLWLMLPRPLWWLYGVLRPLRMSRKFLRRA